MYFSYFRIIVLLLFCSTVSAQVKDSAIIQGCHLQLSALGALKYPGLKAGIDYNVYRKIIHKKRNNGTYKIRYKYKYITTNVGFYDHRYFHTNFFIQFGYLMQRTNEKGWFSVFEPQLGISRTFIRGIVYEVDESGAIKKQRAAGHLYVAPSIAIGFGKDLSIKNDLPFMLFSKVTFFTNVPYNNFIYARIFMELGVSYQFNQFLKHTVRLRTKLK